MAYLTPAPRGARADPPKLILKGDPDDPDKPRRDPPNPRAARVVPHDLPPPLEAYIREVAAGGRSPKPLAPGGSPAAAEEFWADRPAALTQNCNILPMPGMTESQRLNAITRLIIVVVLILAALRVPNWWMFLVFGILLVVLLWRGRPAQGKDEAGK